MILSVCINLIQLTVANRRCLAGIANNSATSRMGNERMSFRESHLSSKSSRAILNRSSELASVQ